jgi:hypothetical protein
MESLPSILIPTLSTPDGLLRASDNDGKPVLLVPNAVLPPAPQVPPEKPQQTWLQQRWAALRRA